METICKDKTRQAHSFESVYQRVICGDERDWSRFCKTRDKVEVQIDGT